MTRGRRIVNLKTPIMKKILFLATMLVASAATITIAQLSTIERSEASSKTVVVKSNGLNLQDTTKPKDTVPSKDSTSLRF